MTDSKNKIYIPEDIKDVPIGRFPTSNKLSSLLNWHTITLLEDLQKITPQTLERILEDRKPPFPELRRLIIAIQGSKTDKITLILEEGSVVESESLRPILKHRRPPSAREERQNNIDEKNQEDFNLQDITISDLIEDFRAVVPKEELAAFIKKFAEDLEEKKEPIFLDLPNTTSNKNIQTKTESYCRYEVPFSLVGLTKGEVGMRLFQNKIYIPACVENLKVKQFPLSKELLRKFLYLLPQQKHNFLLKDLRKVTPQMLERIISDNKSPFTELKCFIIVIQHTHAILYLEELIDFVNIFIEDLKGKEKAIFLGRFGGTSYGKILTKRQVLLNYEVPSGLKDRSTSQILRELNRKLGRIGNAILEKLNRDCIDEVCPLTSQFLVYLTNNKYEIFQYPPEFYIRLFGKLLPKLPSLPIIDNQIVNLSEDAKTIAEQTENFLANCLLPVSLTEVFDKDTHSELIDKDFTKLFFEAVQSSKFNLIQGDKPNELFIELRN